MCCLSFKDIRDVVCSQRHLPQCVVYRQRREKEVLFVLRNIKKMCPSSEILKRCCLSSEIEKMYCLASKISGVFSVEYYMNKMYFPSHNIWKKNICYRSAGSHCSSSPVSARASHWPAVHWAELPGAETTVRGSLVWAQHRLLATQLGLLGHSVALCLLQTLNAVWMYFSCLSFRNMFSSLGAMFEIIWWSYVVLF